jgi:VanZ family protein
MWFSAYNPGMRRRGWLIFWILAIIFPVAALGRFSLPFRKAFDTIFAPTWMHVLMHAWLFAGLGMILMLTFHLPLSPRTGAVTLGVALGVGLLQEGFQSFSQGFFSLGGTIFDLGVDLAGGLAGLMLMGWMRRSPGRTERPGS